MCQADPSLKEALGCGTEDVYRMESFEWEAGDGLDFIVRGNCGLFTLELIVTKKGDRQTATGDGGVKSEPFAEGGLVHRFGDKVIEDPLVFDVSSQRDREDIDELVRQIDAAVRSVERRLEADDIE